MELPGILCIASSRARSKLLRAFVIICTRHLYELVRVRSTHILNQEKTRHEVKSFLGGAAGNRTRVHQTVQIANYKLSLLGICLKRSRGSKQTKNSVRFP